MNLEHDIQFDLETRLSSSTGLGCTYEVRTGSGRCRCATPLGRLGRPNKPHLSAAVPLRWLMNQNG